MNKLSRTIVATGMSLAMLLPLAAIAAAPADGNSGSSRMLASSLSGSMKNQFNQFGSESGLETSRELAGVVGSIINAFMALLGVVLVVIVIYAGYKWMTAQGNSQQVDDAKKMLTQAVIGMIILMAAYAIAQFVMKAVIKGTTGETF